jgi:hypothetical protein
MYGVKSAAGVITQAPSLHKAKSWIDYEFKTVLGHVGEELVRFNGVEWITHETA